MWRHCTFTVHSTQRAEAIQSAVKERFVQSKGLLTDMIVRLERYNLDARARRAADACCPAITNAAKASQAPPVVSSAVLKMTPFAFSLLHRRNHQS